MSVLIGIDPHKRSHAAVAVNGDEQVVGELDVRASRRQIQELLGWAGRYPQRSWAIESAAGLGYLLAQQLVPRLERLVGVLG